MRGSPPPRRVDGTASSNVSAGSTGPPTCWPAVTRSGGTARTYAIDAGAAGDWAPGSAARAAVPAPERVRSKARQSAPLKRLRLDPGLIPPPRISVQRAVVKEPCGDYSTDPAGTQGFSGLREGRDAALRAAPGARGGP